jgi:hypothetical protein
MEEVALIRAGSAATIKKLYDGSTVKFAASTFESKA